GGFGVRSSLAAGRYPVWRGASASETTGVGTDGPAASAEQLPLGVQARPHARAAGPKVSVARGSEPTTARSRSKWTTVGTRCAASLHTAWRAHAGAAVSATQPFGEAASSGAPSEPPKASVEVRGRSIPSGPSTRSEEH